MAERYIEPTIFERGPFGAIKAVVMPAAPKVKPLAPGDVAVLEHAAAAGRAFVAALAEADAVARGAVNNELGSGPTLGFLQSKLSTASSSLGDYSVANLTPVVRPVLAIAELIDDTLAKHAEETL